MGTMGREAALEGGKLKAEAMRCDGWKESSMNIYRILSGVRCASQFISSGDLVLIPGGLSKKKKKKNSEERYEEDKT